MIGRPTWWQRRGLRAWALLPLGLVYALLDALVRWTRRAQPAPLPLICVGNLTAGGAGKTPVTQALAALAVAKGYSPAIISRGYGRSAQGSCQVDPRVHTAADVGDEPLLHARIAPTFVGSDRLASLTLAKQAGATLALMDDGLQHHRVAKDFCLEVRNAADGLGNGLPLPAGPLRQWFGLGTAQVDMMVRIGVEARIVARLPAAVAKDAPLRARPLWAFCGIADPRKFFDLLTDLGARPDHEQAFADHHSFRDDEIDALMQRSVTHQLMTTEKDWVRLSKPLQARCLYVDYHVEFVDPEAVWRPMVAAIKHSGKDSVSQPSLTHPQP